jgi:hypothetical protein
MNGVSILSKVAIERRERHDHYGVPFTHSGKCYGNGE